MARLLVLEYSRPAEEIAEFEAMLREEAEWACWFAWSDGMVKPFGLLDEDGNPKPAYDAFCAAQEETMAEPNAEIQQTMKAFEEAGGEVGAIYEVDDIEAPAMQIAHTDAGLFVWRQDIPAAQILLDARVANPFRATRA